jgi:hypothetical protein
MDYKRRNVSKALRERGSIRAYKYVQDLRLKGLDCQSEELKFCLVEEFEFCLLNGR